MTLVLAHDAPETRLTHKQDNTHHSIIMTYFAKRVSQVFNLLDVCTIQAGDTLDQFARTMGIHIPPSLFTLTPGHQWSIHENCLVNHTTQTTFPVRLLRDAANDGKYTLVA